MHGLRCDGTRYAVWSCDTWKTKGAAQGEGMLTYIYIPVTTVVYYSTWYLVPGIGFTSSS